MLKVTHLGIDEYGDGWYLRFTGDQDDFDELREDLKAWGRAHAKWEPTYAWEDEKQGAWWVQDRLLHDCYIDRFENILEAINEVERNSGHQWIARRRASSARKRTRSRTYTHTYTSVIPPSLLSDYALLAIGPGATLKDAKDSYRSLAKRYHPDAGGTHQGFIALQQSYERVTRWLGVFEMAH